MNGLHLYMNIQNPGMASGVAKTPQKFKHMVNNNVARLAALSSKFDERNTQLTHGGGVNSEERCQSNHIKAPRSFTVSVGTAF